MSCAIENISSVFLPATQIVPRKFRSWLWMRPLRSAAGRPRLRATLRAPVQNPLNAVQYHKNDCSECMQRSPPWLSVVGRESGFGTCVVHKQRSLWHFATYFMVSPPNSSRIAEKPLHLLGEALRSSLKIPPLMPSTFARQTHSSFRIIQ